MSETRLVYFADPMCSWCYGFSPVITALAERFEDRLPLHMVMGGLRAGNAEPMRPKDKESATPGHRSAPPRASRSTCPFSTARISSTTRSPPAAPSSRPAA
jgi:putative protein-disulfide isomerase